jgi:hypothetical protein
VTVTEHELEERKLGTRVTLEEVENTIASEHYFTALDGAHGSGGNGQYQENWEVPKSIEALGLLTFCVLVLKNGFTVTGQSACADPANYKQDIGQRIARQDAINKIWSLLGYELRTKLHQAEKAAALTWLDRAKQERDQLIAKLSKLVAFMKTPAFSYVLPADQKDLRCQAQAMNSYACDLGRRIDRAEKAKS